MSVEMVIPGLVGLWIDGQLGTEILFAVVGFAAGMVGGIWHLLRMLKRGDDSAEGK
ncbi:MAG: AtpZ/AtpI family protein [Pirellulales bacterium]